MIDLNAEIREMRGAFSLEGLRTFWNPEQYYASSLGDFLREQQGLQMTESRVNRIFFPHRNCYRHQAMVGILAVYFRRTQELSQQQRGVIHSNAQKELEELAQKYKPTLAMSDDEVRLNLMHFKVKREFLVREVLHAANNGELYDSVGTTLPVQIRSAKKPPEGVRLFMASIAYARYIDHCFLDDVVTYSDFEERKGKKGKNSLFDACKDFLPQEG